MPVIMIAARSEPQSVLGDAEVEGMWIQKLHELGQIYDLSVMLRPYPAVRILRNRTKELAEKGGVLGKE
jgi:hypothetical protein